MARPVLNAALLAFALAAAPLAVRGEPAPAASQTDARENYAYSVGMLGVVYGFPMVNNTTKRWGMVEKPMGVINTPVNAFFHVPRPANSDDKYGASPTPDVYYSIAWFDLSKGPVVLSVPDAGKRYYSVQMMEMNSDIFGYVGLRTTGNKSGNYLIVGPDWNGKRPKGIADIRRSPTKTGMFIVRVHFAESDANDIETARGLQKATTITPLSLWRTKAPFVATERDVVDPVLPNSDPLWFFKTLNRGFNENPPPPKDQALASLLATAGLGAGQSDDFAKLDPATRAGLQRAQADGLRLLQDVLKSGGDAKVINKWAYGEKTWGRTALSNAFMTRAASQALAGMQEHHIEEVVKLRAYHDAGGELLNGANHRYVVHFAAGQIPEAKAFWSVTLYDDKFNLAANEINRYTRGSNNRDMTFNADGSLDIYIQNEKPAGDKLANWLPAPKGPFNLFMRAYLPGKALIDQTYVPPPVARAD